MFRFANEEYLFLLLIIPILIAIFIYSIYARKKALKKFGEEEIIKSLMPNYSQQRVIIKFVLWLIVVVLLIFAIARPQLVSRIETDNVQGIELIVALDLSNSMLAQDAKYAPFNRLEKAKRELSTLVDNMRENRVGLVVFAGTPYVQLPLTSDGVSAKMFLSSISTDMVPQQGTAIGEALELCVNSFGPDQEISRAIVLLTDGENHEDDAVKIAKKAYEELGITVHVLGIGDPNGVPIPLKNSTDFKRDKNGNVIITGLNEDMCKQIAQAGNGIYAHIDNTNTAMRYLLKELEKMSKADMDKKTYSDYDEYYQFLVGFALLFLLINVFLLDRKNKYLTKIKFFETKKDKN
ncbi:MAG: VWA domain-containing protein [Paludibacteraceae bacterium]|nr:VWA domain-containing protein [Paludibacteraceae bacterium]